MVMGEKARQQRLAALQVLGHIFRFDGSTEDTERDSLRTFGGLELDDAELGGVLGEPIAFEDSIAAVTSKKVRKLCLKTARLIAHAHHSLYDEEARIALVRDAWKMEKGGDPEPHRNRPTDIAELSRRFTHGEASAAEMAQKIRENLGED